MLLCHQETYTVIMEKYRLIFTCVKLTYALCKNKFTYVPIRMIFDTRTSRYYSGNINILNSELISRVYFRYIIFVGRKTDI